jgi:hypothetical protein
MADTTVEVIQEGKDVAVTLTDIEKVRLEKCEQVIKSGLNPFLAVGQALAEIRDNRLYKATHKTWEKYCKEKWDLGKAYANRQVLAYETVNLLELKMAPIGAKNKTEPKMSAMADISEIEHEQIQDQTESHDLDQQIIVFPINESQTRPLTKLSQEDRIKAWDIVLKQLNEGKYKMITSALVKKAVREVCGDAVKKRVIKAKAKAKNTHLVSKIFKNYYRQIFEIIDEERKSEWKTSKKEDVISYLKELIELAELEL